MKNTRPAKLFYFAFTCLLLCNISIFAQTSTANLSGSVIDEKNAAIAGATLKLTNKETGFERTVVTNENGSFNLPLLPPNTYRLTVDSTGFATFLVESVILNTNDQRSISIRLRVGEVGAMVDVDSETQAVNQNPATSTVVNQKFVQNIPLNGRTIQSLITLTPGVVTGPGDGQLSVNGQRTNSNYLTVDGVSANIGVARGNGAVPLIGTTPGASYDQNASGANPGYSLVGGTNNLFSIEELQEVNLQTSNTTAAFGRQAGGQIATTTRSGTNEFHGSIFDYWRHEKFAARNWFLNSSPVPLETPKLRQHNFGAFISGPVIMPWFGEGTPALWKGKDRTFFYFNYEGLRLSEPQAATTIFVPSTELRNLQGLNPVLKTILNAYPLPNNTTAIGCPDQILNGADEFNTTEALPIGTPISSCYIGAFSNRTTMNAFRFKIDHHFNDKNNISFRFNRAPMQSLVSDLPMTSVSSQKTNTLTMNYRSVLSSKIVNELNINWSKVNTSSIYRLSGVNGSVPFGRDLLLPSNVPDTSRLIFSTAYQSFPAIAVGPSALNSQQQWNFTDNVRWAVKNHNLGFGVDYRRMSPKNAPNEYQATISIDNLANLTSAEPLIDNLGIFSADTVQLRYQNFSAYVLDTWQARKNLTLDFGLRWEVNTPPKGVNVPLYTIKGFPDIQNLELSTDPMFETIYTAFAPRFGMAYQLNQKSGRETVLRGGIGIYYDLGQGTLSSAAMQFPYVRRLQTPRTGVPFPPTVADLAPPTAANLKGPYLGQSFTLVAPGYKLPKTYQWSVSLDQSLSSKDTVTISYIGSAGRHLLRRYFYNIAAEFPDPDNILPVNPLFAGSGINVTRNDGEYGDYSDYRALQIQYVRRLSKGLQILANYTLGRSRDTGSSDGLGSLDSYNSLVLPKEFYGYSDFDRRHIFNTAITYELPSLKTENRAMKVLNNIFLKGWASDMNFKYQSAAPLNVTYQYYDDLSSFVSNSFLVDTVPGQAFWIKDSSAPGGKRLNVAAFTLPAGVETTNIINARNGNLVRNSLRGFSLYQMDLSVRRIFSLTEKVRLNFRAEAFNVTNHPNFNPPFGTIGYINRSTGVYEGYPFFGAVITTADTPVNFGVGNVNGGLSSIYSSGGPRTIQFSVKLEF